MSDHLNCLVLTSEVERHLFWKSLSKAKQSCCNVELSSGRGTGDNNVDQLTCLSREDFWDCNLAHVSGLEQRTKISLVSYQIERLAASTGKLTSQIGIRQHQE